jgi:hypothetical protein
LPLVHEQEPNGPAGAHPDRGRPEREFLHRDPYDRGPLSTGGGREQQDPQERTDEEPQGRAGRAPAPSPSRVSHC